MLPQRFHNNWLSTINIIRGFILILIQLIQLNQLNQLFFLVGLKNAVNTFPQKENIIETADTEMKGLVLQHPQEVG
ncbi:hypothetical protein D3C78_871880 [compost metagenome]